MAWVGPARGVWFLIVFLARSGFPLASPVAPASPGSPFSPHRAFCQGARRARWRVGQTRGRRSSGSCPPWPTVLVVGGARASGASAGRAGGGGLVCTWWPARGDPLRVGWRPSWAATRRTASSAVPPRPPGCAGWSCGCRRAPRSCGRSSRCPYRRFSVRWRSIRWGPPGCPADWCYYRPVDCRRQEGGSTRQPGPECGTRSCAGPDGGTCGQRPIP